MRAILVPSYILGYSLVPEKTTILSCHLNIKYTVCTMNIVAISILGCPKKVPILERCQIYRYLIDVIIDETCNAII